MTFRTSAKTTASISPTKRRSAKKTRPKNTKQYCRINDRELGRRLMLNMNQPLLVFGALQGQDLPYSYRTNPTMRCRRHDCEEGLPALRMVEAFASPCTLQPLCVPKTLSGLVERRIG